MTQEFRLKKDLTGQRFGDLLAIKPIGRAKNRNILWKCLCTCGEFLNVTQSSLTRGQRSCLLCAVSRRSEKVVTHGMSKTSTYKSWCGMIERCENVNNTRYQAYGGRGISLCERWRSSFENFLEDMGERPPGTSIDRIDNNGDYEPGNCRWATVKEQSLNRRSNKLITFQGVTKHLSAWAEETGLSADIISYRIKQGWDIDIALTAPAGYRRNRHQAN